MVRVRRSVRWPMLLFLLLCLALVGCGESLGEVGEEEDTAQADLAGDDGAQPATPCAELAGYLCERADGCGVALETRSGMRFADRARCVARFALACEQWRALPDTAPVDDVIHGCVRHVATADCADIQAHLAQWTDSVPSCLADPGARPDGAGCAHDLQCASVNCDRDDTGCGTCAPRDDWWWALAWEGEPCGDPQPRCADGFVCAGGLCERNPACDPAIETCVETVEVAAGERCGGLHEEPLPVCGAGADCLNQNDMGNGTCIAYAPDGGACAGWTGPACEFPAVCADGTCQLPGELACAE